MITFDDYTVHPSIALLFRVDYSTSWKANTNIGQMIKREFAVGFHICMPGVTAD
jgi:hypothetical protein